MDRGHLDMQRLGQLLIEAAAKPRDRTGMVISATGALSIAARALTDLAEPLASDELDADLLREDHQERLDDAQPRLAAYSLETMAKHFGMLRDAVATGNTDMVGKFFDLYVFD
jgi:hypothetical protein